MGTWRPGEPYTDATPDQVTDQANTDRTESAETVTGGVGISALPAQAPTTAGIVPSVESSVTGRTTWGTLMNTAAMRAAMGVGLVDTDQGASVTNTNAATSIHSGTIVVPANDAAAGDTYVYDAYGLFVNDTGTRTVTFAATLGGSSILTAVAINLSGAVLDKSGHLHIEFTFEAVGASVAVNVHTLLESTADNAKTSGQYIREVKELTGINSTAPITLAVTAQPSATAASFGFRTVQATLRKHRAAF